MSLTHLSPLSPSTLPSPDAAVDLRDAVLTSPEQAADTVVAGGAVWGAAAHPAAALEQLLCTVVPFWLELAAVVVPASADELCDAAWALRQVELHRHREDALVSLLVGSAAVAELLCDPAHGESAVLHEADEVLLAATSALLAEFAGEHGRVLEMCERATSATAAA